MTQFVFWLIFIVTIGSACVVAFSRNIVYSAFALFGTFMGVAATFVLLDAEFLALTQVIVYAGGILVLILFAVMLTAKIQRTSKSNPVFQWKIGGPLIGLFAVVMGFVVFSGRWKVFVRTGRDLSLQESSIQAIGNALLDKYLLPFELISVLLLVVMVAAALMVRRNIRGG
jgi:NADH-quinone oxidoreductase subunit J